MSAKVAVINGMDKVGLGLFTPFVRLFTGEEPAVQVREIWKTMGIPLVAIAVFLVLWSGLASSVTTSIGSVPGPKAVYAEWGNLVDDHYAERQKAVEFDARMEKLKEKYAAQGKPWKERTYSGKPTFFDQIATSLKTVFAGFLIASLVAVPIGILCGLSAPFYAAMNPLIQVFKPVSPLAWLPIVMILVSALYTTQDPMFEKSFISSAITVALCSLWATMVNTALGVASVDKDHLNVAKVLRLGFWSRLFKIVLPSSLPLVFAGLRISLGVGWMVLIAAELLSSSEGIGKFVWDQFNNGASDSFAKMMVVVFIVGAIGLLLDRIMVVFQRLVSFEGSVAAV